MLETFTVLAQCSVILASWNNNGPKLPLKFAYPPLFDCILQKSLHNVKEYKILHQKKQKIKFCRRPHLPRNETSRKMMKSQRRGIVYKQHNTNPLDIQFLEDDWNQLFSLSDVF